MSIITSDKIRLAERFSRTSGNNIECDFFVKLHLMDRRYVSQGGDFDGGLEPDGNFPRIIPLVTPTRTDQRFSWRVFSSQRDCALSLLYYVRGLFSVQLVPCSLLFHRGFHAARQIVCKWSRPSIQFDFCSLVSPAVNSNLSLRALDGN